MKVMNNENQITAYKTTENYKISFIIVRMNRIAYLTKYILIVFC